MLVVLAFSRGVFRDEIGESLFGVIAETGVQIVAEATGFRDHPDIGLFPDLLGHILRQRLGHLEGLRLDLAGQSKVGIGAQQNTGVRFRLGGSGTSGDREGD